jgi:3-oxoacyl-[acyl-carrier protein] reductase
MDLKLSGRTALITGSSKGIGLAVAQWFAREGVHVCLVARSADALKKQAAERVYRTFPDVDILVNNAGAIPGGTIHDVDEPAWREGGSSKCSAMWASPDTI